MKSYSFGIVVLAITSAILLACGIRTLVAPEPEPTVVQDSCKASTCYPDVKPPKSVGN
jgi:hypothetical protein